MKGPLQLDTEEDEPLPISKQERMELVENLLESTYSFVSEEPLVFRLPVRNSSTCWNNNLTQEDKNKLVFTSKCGECEVVHEYPKCDKCKTIRIKSGKCQSCGYIKPEEEYYSSYCGNCFQRHEFPNCVECQHYRLKAGRCNNCGAIDPDDLQWKESCLEEDQDYERLIQPVLKKRDLDVKMNSRKFKIYDNCPLCRGFFHSAKACIFRKHALYFEDMKEQLQQLTSNLRESDKNMKKETIKQSQAETQTDISDEYELDEEGQPILMFDRILKALQHLQMIDKDEEHDMEEDEIVQPEHFQDISCELTREKFQNSICKILLDTADFPEDLFNVEGCVWCGSKGHSVLDCLGYTSWLCQYFHLDQHRISYEEQLKVKKRIMARARLYHNPGRPWELYIGKTDGGYLAEKGVRILVKNKRIVNLVPRHLQTTTTPYADFPAPSEVCDMLKLSNKTQPTAQLSVMEELCNQTITIKEDMEQLEMELKSTMSQQSKQIVKDIHEEMQKFYTALMDDRIAELPKQFDQMKTYLSRTIQNLHQRSLQSDIMVVKTFRDLFEARTPESNMMWNRGLCRADPTYQFRGRWRQLSDRLNTIADYTIKSNLVIPLTGNKHAEDLRTMAHLLIEVMQKMFHQAKILDFNDLLDMEDFALFQETVSRTMQMQAISANQICNFIQQLVYYNQCTIEKTLDYMNYKDQLEIFLGILLQPQ